MLIGNRERFGFELVPVMPSWERRYAPEAACWAGLAIWVTGKNLCAYVRAGEDEIRQHLFVPLGPVADWLVRSYPALACEERASLWPTGSWLHEAVRLWGDRPPPSGMDEDQWLGVREAFWKRHFLAAGAEGSRLPNLAVMKQDDEANLVWAPPRFAVSAAMALLHPEGRATVGWSELEQPVRAFIGYVAGAFKDSGHGEAFGWLGASIAEILRPATSDAVGLYCARPTDEVARILGVAPQDLTETLQLGPAADPSRSPICQTIRDLPPSPAKGIGNEILATVSDAAKASKESRTRWQEARARALDCAMAGTTPQQQGQLAAQGLRAALGLDSEPIVDVPTSARSFGTEVRSIELRAANERMLVAVAGGGAPVVTVLKTSRTVTPWGERFEQARGLGHAVLDPLSGDVFGAASSPYAQHRRRVRSGAFAAELLLPAGAVESASAGHLDGALEGSVFRNVLEAYVVGARTAAHQFYNHGWLSGPAVRDELIDEYAAT